jgi:hypothetical protein
MNCRDFREIADSYLSDELAVETNHEIFQHLENCAVCRRELATRRDIREKLAYSLKNSPDFQLNPIFANKLKAELAAEAPRRRFSLNWKILAPLTATVLIALTMLFALFYQPQNASAQFAAISRKAVKGHEECGLKHYRQWEKNIGGLPAEKISFVKPLENKDTQILEVHNCKIDGKVFAHYVLRHHDKIISVLKTESENIVQTNTNEESSIICKKEKGLQMSTFKIGPELIFVISDMSEAENLSLARQLSDSNQARIEPEFEILERRADGGGTIVAVAKMQGKWLEKR